MKSWANNTDCGWRMADGGLKQVGDANPKSEIPNPESVERAGFTLIELLLVMVILATLAAIVTPKFAKRSGQAKITAARTQVAELEVALDAFEIDVGRYPTTAEGLRALVERPASQADGWQQPYLKRDVPKDPWGGEYMYRYPGQYNEDGYDLSSYGPDQKLGGSDDITNWTTDQTR